MHSSRRSSLLYFLLHAPKNHYELAASFLRKLIVADPKRRKHRAPSGHVGFVVQHPEYGRCHGAAKVPHSLVRLMDAVKKRETYIGQFELVAAIVPFLS